MNRIIIAALLIGTAGAVITFQKASLAGIKADTLQQIQEREAAAGELTAAHAQIVALRADIDSERLRTESLRWQAAESGRSGESAAPIPPAPETEGIWPANDPWFYLPKDLLPLLGFDPFTPEGRVSEEAMLLFGMSPQERIAVEDAFATMNRRLLELELAALQPVAVSEHHRQTFPGTEVEAFELPAFVEESAEARERFEREVRAMFGENRADLFLEHASRFAVRHSDDLGAYPRHIVTWSKFDDEDDLEFRSGVVRVENKAIGLSKFYYADDETAAAYNKYRELLQRFREGNRSAR